MAKLIKPWTEGDGNLTVTYNGSGDGSAIFTSDVNEGLDREMPVSFLDPYGNVVATKSINQEGRREIFEPDDFYLSDGSTYNVLKPEKPYNKKIEYLESAGAQYIDTGYNINTNTDEVEVKIQGLETTVYKWFFGEHDNGARFGLGSGDGTNKRNVAYGPTTYKVKDVQVYDTPHTFLANSNGVFLDGVNIKSFVSFSSASTIYLFHLNLSGQASYMSRARIWYYKHKRNGELIRDLIPVIGKDGTTCMYDKVSGDLLHNAGFGDFIAGEPIQ